MCGIAGFMTIDGRMPPASLIDTLASSLAHRGPDGNGRHLAASYYLMQTRLAIIDLVTGDQPIFAPDGTVVAVNGEIYNHVELRAQYAGDSFSTRSDCEMPLHSFRRLGARFAEPLRGMYAIALFDPKEETLYLSRDRFGQKPLYYAEVATGIIFASEPQAILKSGLIVPELSRRAGQELLQLQFTTGRATAFAGINRVLPGETMVVQRGRITGRHFLSALPDTPPEKIGEEEALERLDAALMDSVNVHQRSDVPYGLFFSGGIDSTAILAAMARLNASPVRAFTAGFPGTGVADERAHARALAQRLGAKHTEIEVTEEDFWQTLPLVVSATDDPAADYAIIPTWHLARAAARELKVVLGGEGGDEIFAGYGRYRSVRRPVIFGGRAMRTRGHLDGLGLLRDESRAWREGIAAAEARAARPGYSRLQAAQASDCAEWLPNDLLIKFDRCLMAHSMEGRAPFLDPAMTAAGFALPDHLKIRRGLGKHLLRLWLQRHVPESEPFAAKRGFTVPVGEWIAHRADGLGPLVAASAGVSMMCKPEGVLALFARLSGNAGKHGGMAAWLLLYFALWHKIHIEGVAARAMPIDEFLRLS